MGARFVAADASSRLSADRRGPSLPAAGLLRPVQAGNGGDRALLQRPLRHGDGVHPRALDRLARRARRSRRATTAARSRISAFITTSTCATSPKPAASPPRSKRTAVAPCSSVPASLPFRSRSRSFFRSSPPRSGTGRPTSSAAVERCRSSARGNCSAGHPNARGALVLRAPPPRRTL